MKTQECVATKVSKEVTGQVTIALVPVYAEQKPVNQSHRAYWGEKLKSGMV